MTAEFKVSVIIPVYNAAAFLENSVQSALLQPEVGEILLIEDGSTDNSLEICRQLTTGHDRIKLLQHPDGENRGAGASRNLGLEAAKFPYIAFLDADDEYLSERFHGVGEAFEQNPDADGMYMTIGVKYYDEQLKSKHLSRVRWEETGVRKYIGPEDLYRTLATGKYGHIHLDGVVLKKSSLDDSLKFDVSLRQCQDSDLILRLSTTKTLYALDPGRIAALRGVHHDNRVFNHTEAIHYRNIYLRKCIRNGFYGSNDFVANMYIVTRYIGTTSFFLKYKRPGFALGLKSILVGLFLLTHPGVSFTLLKTLFRKR